MVAKLFLDQVIFSPLFFIIYYVVMGFLNGDLKKAKKQIKEELISMSINSTKLWLPVTVTE